MTSNPQITSRVATLQDAPSIAEIYNQGIEDRTSTFETRPRSTADIEKWFDGMHPIVVLEVQGEIKAFASTSGYRPRDCYAGIAEFSVYVDRASRGQKLGEIAMRHLIQESEKAGFWKLLSRVFPENQASLKMLSRMGFREVGTYHRHGQLEGIWKDVVIVERLLGAVAKI
ncbi:arsinothricin resistance N-acetyltransferase ArsN1 family A [Deinococcus roseus]|uniref:N-acetyltransferase n=1 Tax=Deinococcus roseus TaxID=392414 RepID=A0ABQ2DGG8_9DEIO|nr:arsinothricin resistance N-acetyltransferase ArsN1 family A [Deinococcus roseus]GGJ53613.1 N-acetyltransferase [Deinococcus roseus]